MSKIKKSNSYIETKHNGVARVLTDNSDFDTIETYKTIRTNIMFSLPKKEHGKVIALTSASPSEGKTTSSINLAITFAQTGAKVVLVDCDLRKAHVHRYLGIERGAGVSNILCGFSEPKDTIRKDVIQNLDVITSGEIPVNPAELLGTPEFEKFVEELTHKYDYVFIDTPPVTVVTDALIIAKSCTGMVIVVKENMTKFDMLDKTVDYLRKVDAHIIGAIVLNGNEKSRKYGYYKKKRYEYK